jgi:DNA polymerase
MSDDKRAQMKRIAEALENLEDSPLYEFRQDKNYSYVLGEGDLNAKIMFIGEAPGAQEAKSGRPFVGTAGKVLDELLNSIGLNRRDVYITNIVKDRPPENRDPRTEEIELYAPFLVEQIDIIKPEVIATLGRFAMDFILARFDATELGEKIGALHGKVLKGKTPYGEVTIVPLYHPAAAFYNQSLEDILRSDIQVLKKFI